MTISILVGLINRIMVVMIKDLIVYEIYVQKTMRVNQEQIVVQNVKKYQMV